MYLLTFGDLKAFKARPKRATQHVAPRPAALPADLPVVVRGVVLNQGLNHVQLSAPDLPPVAECVDVSAALTRAAAAMHTKLR